MESIKHADRIGPIESIGYIRLIETIEPTGSIEPVIEPIGSREPMKSIGLQSP